MNNYISYLDEILSKESFQKDNICNYPHGILNIISISPYNNNNDTLNILLTISVYFKFYLYSIYEIFISYTSVMKHRIYQIEFLFLILILLFGFALTFENNSNISQKLIINAYFPHNKITHLSYEIIQEKNLNYYKNKTGSNKYSNINQDIKNKYNKCNYCDNFSEDENKIRKKEIDKEAYIKQKYYNNDYNRNIISIQNDEIYILFWIPMKSALSSFFSFGVLFIFIKYTFTSKIRGNIFFNFFFSFLFIFVVHDFYESKLYLSSNFFFILLIYVLKCYIDSIYLIFNYKRKDFEIFTTNLIAFDSKQLLLKFILLTILTLVSGYLSIFIFKSCINYIVFYLCLITLIAFLCNCFEPIAPYYMKPLKNISMFIVGVVNFYLTKIVGKNDNKSVFDLRMLDENEKNNDDANFSSLSLVSDFFTMFCFDYINNYIEYQMGKYFILSDKKNNYKKYLHTPNNRKIYEKELFFIILFSVSISIGITGIYKIEYMDFILSVYLSKIIFFYFLRVYKIKICRLIHCIIEMVYILTFFKISNEEDYYLLNFLLPIFKTEKNILNCIIKFLTLSIFSYFCIILNIVLYFSSNPFNDDEENEIKQLPTVEQILKISNIDAEKLKNFSFQIISQNNSSKKNNFLNMLFISSDCSLNFFNLCIIFIIIENYEEMILIQLIYCLLSVILQLTKLFIISQIKNNVEFLFGFFISFIFTVRSLRLSLFKQSMTLYIINHISLYLLVTYYSIDAKKNLLITIIILSHLLIEFCRYNSYFIILDVISLIFSPIIKNCRKNKTNMQEELNSFEGEDQTITKNKKMKSISKNYSLLFSLPLLIFFLVQLGFQNYFSCITDFYMKLKTLMTDLKIIPHDHEDADIKSYNENENQIEYNIISGIIKWLKE